MAKITTMLPLQQFPMPRPVSGWRMKARLSLRSWWSGSIFRMLLRSCESWRNTDWKTSRNTLGCPLLGIEPTDVHKTLTDDNCCFLFSDANAPIGKAGMLLYQPFSCGCLRSCKCRKVETDPTPIPFCWDSWCGSLQQFLEIKLQLFESGGKGNICYLIRCQTKQRPG